MESNALHVTLLSLGKIVTSLPNCNCYRYNVSRWQGTVDQLVESVVGI